MKFSRIRIGELLIQAGVLTKDELKKSLELQKTSGKRIGEILIENDYITEHDLMLALSKQMNIPYLDLDDYDIPQEMAQILNESTVMDKHALPLKVENHIMTLAINDPLDYALINDLQIFTKMKITPVLCEKFKIDSVAKELYAAKKAYEAAEELNREKQFEEEEEQTEEEELEVIEDADDDQPVIKMVNTMIEQAVLLEASDIHIEPQKKRMVIRFRIDGRLNVYMRAEISALSAVVSRIKFIGGMNIAEKRLPQDGRLNYRFNGTTIDLRISVLPTIFGEKVVMRITTALNFDMKKEEIGFTPENLEHFNNFLQLSHGIILLTGPTGSGKSTTLYTALKELNRDDINIITVENPVEMIVPGVSQVEVSGENRGLTFALALRSILRQDPDIVMVGEIRDQETASIAASVAITGHLVFSTMHTYDSPSAIVRLVDMGVAPYMVSSAVAGVISQRLVRKICPHCKKAYEATLEDKKILGVSADEPLTLYKGEGCDSCKNTGYKGRTTIHEVMRVTQAIKTAIHAGKSTAEIKEIAISEGMTTLSDNCRQIVLAGATTTEEMLRTCSAEGE